MRLIQVKINASKIRGLPLRGKRWTDKQKKDLGGQLAALVKKQTLHRIHKSKRDPAGKKWKKRTQYYRWPLMVKTQKLAQSLKRFRRGEDYGVESSNRYLKYHQYGTIKMAQRQILGLSKDDKRELESHVRAWTKQNKP